MRCPAGRRVPADVATSTPRGRRVAAQTHDGEHGIVVRIGRLLWSIANISDAQSAAYSTRTLSGRIIDCGLVAAPI
jgi:hypothetical protein